MRTTALLVAVLIPATSFAWDSTAEDVQFTGQTDLFRGVEYSAMLPDSGSPVALQFSADTNALLQMEMGADSEILWPEALTHTWHGIIRGGQLGLTTETKLGASVYIDLFGYEFNVPLWERDFTWGGTSKFDSLLLPGGTNSATVGLEAEEFFGLDYTFDITEDVAVTIGGDIFPAAYATVTGESVTTNGFEVTQRGDSVMLDVPSSNDGTVDVQSLWTGNVTAEYGIELTPWAEVCIDGLPCFAVTQFSYLWDLGNDEKAFSSDMTQFEQPIPALTSGNTIDMGTIEVGQYVEVEFGITNLSELELQGEAIYTGDAYIELVQDDFVATNVSPDSITLAFAPDEEGTFSGVLTLESNDPVNPTIEIPVIGTATPLPVPEDEDPNLDDDDNGDLGAARGCGCNSTPTSPAAPMSILALGLLGLAVRRRQTV